MYEKVVRITLRLPDETHQLLETLATMRGSSLNKEIVQRLQASLSDPDAFPADKPKKVSLEERVTKLECQMKALGQ